MSDVLTPDVAASALKQRYMATACLTFLLYDIVLTLEIEIRSVWFSRWTLGKVLFLLNRYIPPPALIFNSYLMTGVVGKSEEFCLKSNAVILALQAIEACGIIPLIFLIRVWLLYNKNRLILIWLVIFALAEVSVGLATVVIGVDSGPTAVAYLEPINMCLSVVKPANVWLIFIPQLLFDGSILFLTVRKTWMAARSNVRTPLMSVLLRDGIAYYVLLLVTQIYGIFDFLFFPDALYLIMLPLGWSVASTIMSRVLLDTREAITSPSGSFWEVSLAAETRGTSDTEMTRSSQRGISSQDMLSFPEPAVAGPSQMREVESPRRQEKRVQVHT